MVGTTYRIQTMGFLTIPEPSRLIDYAEKKAARIIRELQGKSRDVDAKKLESELVMAKLVDGRKKKGIFEKVSIIIENGFVDLTFFGPEE